VVLGLTLIHEIVLVAYPGWYQAFAGFTAETELHITPAQFLSVYMGEALFVILFCAAIYFGDRGNRSFTSGQQSHVESTGFPDRDRLFISALVIAAAALYIGQFFQPTLDYEGLAVSYQPEAYTGLLALLSGWGGAFIRWPGLFAAGYALVSESIPRSIRFLAGAVLIAEMAYSMIYGTRGGIVWVISVIVLAGYCKSRKLLLAAVAIVGIAFAPLFSWMHTNMRYVTLAAPAGTLNWQMIPALVEGAIHHQVLNSSAIGDTFIESWAIRAQGPLNSTYLYRFFDQGDGGFYKPDLGAIVYPVPRVLWPNKPSAGSTDSSTLNGAIFRVQQAKPDSSGYDMGPVLASGHAYWEGGWAYLYFAAIVTGWVWSRLLRWAEKSGCEAVSIIVLVFTAALPIDGFFSTMTPLFAYIRLIWTTLLPMLMFIAAVDWWIRRRKLIEASRSAGLSTNEMSSPASALWNSTSRPRHRERMDDAR